MLITCVESTHPARPHEVRKLLQGRRASSNQHQLLFFKGHKLFSYLCPTENISRYQLSKEGGRREQATCFSKNKEPDVLLKWLLVLNPLGEVTTWGPRGCKSSSASQPITTGLPLHVGTRLFLGGNDQRGKEAYLGPEMLLV